MRLKTRAAALAAVLALGGCDDAPTSTPAAGPTTRLVGMLRGNLDDGTLDCGAETPVALVMAGTVAPLRQGVATQQHCIDQRTGSISDGVLEFIATDGGSVEGRYSGTVGAPRNGVATFTGGLVITRVTGAYAGATGNASLVAHQNVATGAVTGWIDGIINR